MSAATEAAELLEELVGVDLMPHEFHDRGARLARELREQDAPHPLARCVDCQTVYTICYVGNMWCPGCGSSSEESTEVTSSGS